MTVRRTGKVGGDNQQKTGSEQAAEQGTQNLQSRLQQKANQGGLLVADNFQAEMLVTALTFIQQGQYGPKTAAILEAMETGSIAPLEDWGNQILTWNQPALLSSASESSG
jgi:hypothetical protein